MRVLLIELNEFNEDLLREASQILRLKNLEKILHFHRSETWTEDTYESGSLEPWVQWVSVHRGVSSTQHRVKHLGDMPKCPAPQLWERLSERGISSGIWGAMNAQKGDAAECRFFLPDPWTLSEGGTPVELSSLLRLLRDTAQNYTKLPKLSLLLPFLEILRLFHDNQLKCCFAKELLSMAKNALLYKAKPFVFISSFDALSSRLFLKYKKRFSPDFSLLFLNSIAHLQHHLWENRTISPCDPLAHGLKVIDQILGDILAEMRIDDWLLVTNALSQKNTCEEKPWILYRQIDPKDFLQTIGIRDAIVAPHMTHDAHLFFPSIASAAQAKKALESIQIQGSPLFYLETYPEQPCKLFYRIQFTDALPQEARFHALGRSFRFFDLFTAIVQRTGRHTQKGTLLCNKAHFPPQLANHELSNKILEIFR